MTLFSDTNFQKKLLELARKALTDVGFSSTRADWWDRLLLFLVVLVIASLSYLLFCKLCVHLVHLGAKKSRLKLPMLLYRRNFFYYAFWFIPPIIVLFLLPLVFSPQYEHLLRVLSKIINICLAFISARLVISFVEAAFDYYLQKNELATSPYKAAVEMARLFIYGLFFLSVVGILMNVKLGNVITGLSAFAAVLVLIFKDTLLGFVAGMQLAQNKMIKIGDWITVPDTLANGTVIEINILTVRVRNFDNTIVYVPSYTLVTNSFQNWRGMVDSGVRRMKKAVVIDINSIVRTDAAMLDKVYADPLVKKYLNSKGLETFDNDRSISKDALETNLGLFRLWVYLFLIDHPNVTNDPYLIIHNLPASGSGLPLELIFFITTTEWAKYEEIQSLIFEQIMSMLAQFALKQFQYEGVVGADIKT